MVILTFIEDQNELYVKCSDLLEFLSSIELNVEYSNTDRTLIKEIKDGLIKSMNN